MLKPIRWQTFPRDFFVIQIGLALFGLSIAMTIQANLGAFTWSVLDVPLAKILGLSVGAMSVISGFGVLGIALLLHEQIGWGTLTNILSIGPWLDLARWLIPSAQNNLPLQIVMLLLGVLLQGIASPIYIGVNAGAGPRDSLMLAVHRMTGVSIRRARAAIEITVCLIGWLLGGPIGFGTLAFALLIGPAVQGGFKIFKIQPHKIAEVKIVVPSRAQE